MDIRINTDNLVDEVADAVTERLRALISAQAAPGSTYGAAEAPSEIMGIKPYALYPVAFASDRWDIDKDTVRRKSDEELPRANWQGGEIRYRGVDILRYEGVDVEKRLPENVHPMPASDAQEPAQERAPRKADAPRRPYNQSLPEL